MIKPLTAVSGFSYVIGKAKRDMSANADAILLRSDISAKGRCDITPTVLRIKNKKHPFGWQGDLAHKLRSLSYCVSLHNARYNASCKL